MSLLKSSGLFVVNQDDINYAISTDVLKEYIAPLAKQELGDPYSPGHPGVIMPGDGFVYDESTGLLEVNIPSGLVYVGLIGSDSYNDEVLDPDYYGDVPGHFYIVTEEVTLCNDVWPGITKDPSGCIEVHINDKVIMNNDEEWDVIPAITEDFIHVGENPPSDPDEGDLWWDSDPHEMTLYIYVHDAYGQGQWVTAAPPTSLDGINATINTALAVQEEILTRVAEGEAKQVSIRSTLDNLSEAAVKKAGDTMTGALRVEPTEGNTTLRIQGSPTSSDGSNILNVYSNSGSQLFWVDSKNAGLTNSAKTPRNDSHLVTKKYVDDHRGWGVPYKYRFADQKAENLRPGEFFIADNNSIYCHRYDLNSKDMGISSDYVTDQERFGLMKVYAANGNLLHMIEFRELRIGQGTNKYCRWLYRSKLKSYSSWMESETYYLADGLLFPY